MAYKRTQSGMKLFKSFPHAKLPLRTLPVLILLATLAFHPVSLAQKLAESPWPTYRGDFKRTGRSNYKGPATNQVRWVFSTGLSEKNGGIETDPVIGPDGAVSIGANNGIFYALNPEDGSIRWAFPTEFDTFAIYSSPIVDQQGLVYFGAKDGNVYALRAPKRGVMGELVWSLNLGTTIQTSPAFTPDGTLVIGADDWAYYGITPPRGGTGPRIKWRFQTQGTLITSPAVDSDGTVFVASMDGKVYALEPPKDAGQPVKVRWSFSSGTRDEKGGFENAPAIDTRGLSISAEMTGFFTRWTPRPARLNGPSMASRVPVIEPTRSSPLQLSLLIAPSTSAAKTAIFTQFAIRKVSSALARKCSGSTKFKPVLT